jgi:hypothetical protein
MSTTRGKDIAKSALIDAAEYLEANLSVNDPRFPQT